MNIRCSFWVALLVWTPSLIYANRKCAAKFTFPDRHLDSGVLTVAENTTISLTFFIQELTADCLNNLSSFRLEVQKLYVAETKFAVICNIRYTNRHWRFEGPCTAASEPQGGFQLTYTVNRTDDKQLLLWTSNANVTTDKSITFNVTYPPVIETFHLGGDAHAIVKEIPQGQQLSVSCAWNHGNPRSAGIIYRYRNNENKRELKRTGDSTTSLTHTISSPQCDDSGIYSCEVGDVSVNKTLLVKCAPTNLTALTPFTFEEVSSAELWFTVHSYTPRMKSCRLEAMSSPMPSTARNEDCNSSLTVTGSPPDLTVSVRLDSVRREDEGTWKLTLTNNVGTGEVEFNLAVTEQQIPGDQTNLRVVLIAGGVGLALAVIAVVVVVIIIYRKTKGKAGTEANVAWKGRNASERESEQPEMITNTLYGGSDDCTMIINNMYQGSGSTPMTSGCTYEEVGSGRQEPKPSTSKPGVIVGDSDYAEVDQRVKKDKKKPKNSPGEAENATGDMYVDVADIKKNKGTGKQLKSGADNGRGDAMGDMYVGADEVRAKKKEKKANSGDAMGDMYVGADEVRAKKKKKKAANAGDAMGDMYVGADEVRAKKKGKKGHGGGSDSQETAGADDGRHQNADGLIYVALEFGDRPATSYSAPPAAEETEYADISPNGPPPRPLR